MSLRVLSPTLLTIDGWACVAAASIPLGHRALTGALAATGSQLLFLNPSHRAYRQAALVNAGWVALCLATAAWDGAMGVMQWGKAEEMKNTP